MKSNVFNMPTQPLFDDKVILRLLLEDDFEAIYQVASDPLIWEQHPANDRWKRAVFQPYFNGAIESKTTFLIKNKQTNEVIGWSRFYDYKLNPKSIAIGYTFLSREFWGGVYNKSVKKLMIDYAFQFVESVFFHVGVNNLRSQKAVLKMGGVFTKEVETGFEYEIKKADWFNKSEKYQ